MAPVSNQPSNGDSYACPVREAPGQMKKKTLTTKVKEPNEKLHRILRQVVYACKHLGIAYCNLRPSDESLRANLVRRYHDDLLEFLEYLCALLK